MHANLSIIRERYFHDVASFVGQQNAQFIVLTHILNDRPELLSAISKIGKISLIIGIPYSIDCKTLKIVEKKYKTVTPSLEQLSDKNFLVDLIRTNIDHSKPAIIIEIGGYFAPTLNILSEILKDNLIGIIEDTETGHKKYEALPFLHCPVISVARSVLKENEDFLVGISCVYSAEKLVRKMGFPLVGKQSMVIGFGKVGRSVANELSRRNCSVVIYEIDALRKINAISMGFKVLSKECALQQSDIIYGTTGVRSISTNDLPSLKKGVVLVSCSSKDIEFDLKAIDEYYTKYPVIEHVDYYQNQNNSLYLLAGGRPVNFVDGAVIGPVLALVQAEIIASIKSLLEIRQQNTEVKTHIISQNSKKILHLLAEKWIEYFYDEYYR